jgi:colanic acid biosynthesis protein WcaH
VSTVPRAALDQALATIEQACPDARLGLGEPLFLAVSRLTPLVNVDLLVVDDGLRTLMTWREDRFYGPGWHVPGGVVRFKESLAARLRAVAALELGAQIAPEPVPVEVFELTAPDRDLRGHFITLAYRCRLQTPLDPARQAPAGARPSAGQWAWFEELPPDTIRQHRIYQHLFNRRSRCARES